MWPVYEYIVRLSRNVLGLACYTAAVIYRGCPPTIVWIGQLELTCGRLNGSCFHYYRDEGIFIL